MKKILTALILAVASVGTFAQMRYVAEGTNDLMYREGATTYGYNNGRTALSWFTFKNKQNTTETKTLVQVHCDSRLVRIIREVVYYDNILIQDTNENWYQQWYNPVPETLAVKFQTICTSR